MSFVILSAALVMQCSGCVPGFPDESTDGSDALDGDIQTGEGTGTTDQVTNDTPNLSDVLVDVTRDATDVDIQVPADVVADTTPDTAADVTPDTTMDVTVDTFQDVPADTVPDTAQDTEPETMADIVSETGEVVAPSCGDGTIAGLLTCAEGTVDVMLMDAVVTYVFDAGFFLYDGSTTRGIQVYTGTGTGARAYALPAVGDTIMLHVTKFGNFSDQQEVTGSEDLIVMNQTGDAAGATIDLNASPSPIPSEDIESRSVKGDDLTVAKVVCDHYVEVGYGTETHVTFRASDALPLCEGAVFDLLTGVVTDYKGEHRLHTFKDSDIANVVTTGCTAPDSSNWGFEEDTGTDDPPADFFKDTCVFSAVRTTAEKWQGNASCELTWTSTETQELFMSQYVEKGTNTRANITAYAMDGDPAGRVRVGLRFYDVNKVSLDTSPVVYSAFTSDAPGDWQMLEREEPFPEGAAYVRGFVHMYDVADPFTTATAYVDSLSVTALPPP